jgi:hypothetical protein
MTRQDAHRGLLLGVALTLAHPAFGQPPAAESGAHDPAPVSIRYQDQTEDGWCVAETANFRTLHHQSRRLVERVARAAEKARADVLGKWFGKTGSNWQPRCDVYLYANASDFSQATGVPEAVPGFSTSRCDGGRVVSRRIDLRCDAPNCLEAILPHEVAHVVLAAEFGDLRVPPWANEGVAVLTEPRSRADLHLRGLARFAEADELFPSQDLLQFQDYPQRRLLAPFYAQSVSLVEFLAEEKGPETFTQFLRDGLRKNYQFALRRHYGWGCAELDRRWREHALSTTVR